MNTTLTITHTPQDGTLLEGTRKGDGAWDAIKAAQAAYRIRGWKYFPSIRAIGVAHSRDRAPKLGLIDETAAVLREAGFDVGVQVDTAPRPMERAEEDRAVRMSDRATALELKAQRKSAESDARWAASEAIADMIPMGQPILVGHHSERRHRRDLDRIDGHMRAGVELSKEANRAAAGAESASRHMAHRENPRRVFRRVEKLEADRRRVQHSLDGHTTRHLDGQGNPVYVFEHEAATGEHRTQLEAEAAHLDEQLRYWKAFLEEERAAGRWNPIDLANIREGDMVRYRFGWRKVARVNKKTVSVETDYSWTDKLTIDDILEHQAASQ